MEFLGHSKAARFDFLNFMKETSSRPGDECVLRRQALLGLCHGTLGPPDLLSFSREKEEGLFGVKKREKFFTYCYGMPMASETILHMFIYENFFQTKPCLSTNSAQKGVFGFKRGSFSFSSKTQGPSNLKEAQKGKAKKVQVLVYNIFSGQDVRYTLHVPGSSSLVSVDAYGNEYSSTQINWEEVFVSSMLRLACASNAVRFFVVYPEYHSFVDGFTESLFRRIKAHPFAVKCLLSNGEDEKGGILQEMRKSKKLIYSIFLNNGKKILSSLLKFFLSSGHAKEGFHFFFFFG